MNRKKIFNWYWMPITVFLMGILSISLLMGTSRIMGHQHDNHVMIEAVKDLQIRVSMWHLWFQEALNDEKGGAAGHDMKAVWDDYKQATTLIEALQKGGKTEDDVLENPLEDPELLSRAANIAYLLRSMETLAVERMKDPTEGGIGSDLDRRFNQIFGMFLLKTGELEKIVEDQMSENWMEGKRLNRGILLVWSLIVISATLGLLNRERRRRTAEESLLASNEQLLAQTEELQNHREHLAELVDMRTGELTSANEGLKLEIAERRRAEEALRESQKQLRHLSSRLLTVQEDEKRRIARELHDGLGQALTLVKIQLRSIEKRLQEDQSALREDCEGILQYINTVIEDVRRISRDLCPLILDDLGLTRAIRWLTDSLSKNNGIWFTVELADIDSLFSKEDQTAVFRVLQEALTNIVKHSGAAAASATVRRYGERAAFFIEDNGKGFEAASVLSQGAGEECGLGLKSMKERVMMLGGYLSLWSRRGEGTRISFSIPSTASAADLKTLAKVG